MKKLTSFSAAMLLLLSAVSCEKKETTYTETAPSIAVSQTMYKEERIPFPDDLRQFKALGYSEGIGVRVIYTNPDGKFRVADYDEGMVQTASHDLFDPENMYDTLFDITDSGTIFAFNIYENRDGDSGDEDAPERARFTYEIIEFSADCTEISRTPADMGNFNGAEDFIMDVTAAEDGFIIRTSRGLYLMDRDGNLTDEALEADKYFFGHDSGGRLIIADSKGYRYADELNIHDLGEMTPFGEYLTMQQGIVSGHDGFDAFFMLNDGIFGLTNAGLVKITDYRESVISCSDYYYLTYAGTGKFAGVGIDRGSGSYFMALFTVRPENYEVNKQDIVIGAGFDYGIPEEITRSVNYFNKHSDDYMAKVKGYDGATDSIRADILAGSPPDVYFYDDPEQMIRLANIGSAVNLYEMSAEYGGFSEDDIMDNIREAYGYRDGLYMLSEDFQVLCAWGSSKMFDTGKLTLDEFRQVTEKIPEGMYFDCMYGCRDRMETFKWLCIENIGDWVDFENAECRFDTPEFLELLDLSMSVPLIPDCNLDEWADVMTDSEIIRREQDERMRFKNGTLLMFSQIAYNTFADLKYHYEHYAMNLGVDRSDYVLLYQPSDDPRLGVRGDMYFSLLKGGSSTEGGWDYINYILGTEYTSAVHGDTGMLNTLRSTFDHNADRQQYLSTLKTLTSPDGSYTYDNTRYGGTSITDEEMAEYRGIIADSTVLRGTYTELSAILTEEYAQFAAGEITASVCAERMQDRVTIYLSENS